jgi:eukaryotic-like serine/threonine-protein kinase
MIWAVDRVVGEGHYTVKAVLKQSQLSVTYLAVSSRGEQVVIKTPNDAAIPQGDFDKLQARFVKEAFKLKNCQQSNYIVKVQEPFQEDGVWCIPMEYVGVRLWQDGIPCDRQKQKRFAMCGRWERHWG